MAGISTYFNHPLKWHFFVGGIGSIITIRPKNLLFSCSTHHFPWRVTTQLISNRDFSLAQYRGFLKWGYPKSSILVGFSLINHPAIAVPDGNLHIGGHAFCLSFCMLLKAVFWTSHRIHDRTILMFKNTHLIS